MKTNKSIILLATLFNIVSYCQLAAQDTNDIVIGKKQKIQSSILSEERTYVVGLPASYDGSTQSYPILVMLDGRSTFHSYTGMIDQMSHARQIPEMITVAVYNTDRVRDFTPTKNLISLNGSTSSGLESSGGSQEFLAFLEKELLVEIESNYRTNGYKTLVGISHAGLLVGLSYLSPNSSFGSYICMDPSFWWDDQLIVKQIKTSNLKQLATKRFYLSTADNYERWRNIGANKNSQEMFFATLKNKGMLPPQLMFESFDDENHWTVSTLSLYSGLQFVYKGFNMEDFYDKSISEIIAYYTNNFGGNFSPPENDVNRLGYYYLGEEEGEGNDKQKALELFLLNVANYPNSFNAFDSLGEAYKKLGNRKEAIKNYKISLKLNPQNESAIQALKELK